ERPQGGRPGQGQLQEEPRPDGSDQDHGADAEPRGSPDDEVTTVRDERETGIFSRSPAPSRGALYNRLANQSRIRRNRSSRCRGLPERESSWFSSGKRTNTTSRRSFLRATKSCSACSIGQRRSSSEWRMSSGVTMSLA